MADKRLKYPNGRSRIAYIGTIRKGGKRIAQSVASKADSILSLHGVRSFHARIVTCRPRQKIRTWHKLERALLIAFCERFGQVPKGNSHGKKMTVRDEFTYFRKQGVTLVIDELA